MRVTLYDVNFEEFDLRFFSGVHGKNYVKDFIKEGELDKYLKAFADAQSNEEGVIAIKHECSYKFVHIKELRNKLYEVGIILEESSLELLLEMGLLSESNYILLVEKGVDALFNKYIRSIVAQNLNEKDSGVREFRFGMKMDNFNKLREVSHKTRIPQETIINLALEISPRRLINLCVKEYENKILVLEDKLSKGKHFEYKTFKKNYNSYKVEYTPKDYEGGLVRDALVILYKDNIYAGSIEVDLLKLDNYLIY